MVDIINPNFPAGLEDSVGKRDTRNVIDHYKQKTDEEIRAELAEIRTPLVVLFENFAHDFNIGSGIRNANAFAVGEVVIVGRKSYDRRGTVGTYMYENISFAPNSAEVIERYRAQGYRIVAVDNLDGATSVDNYQWQEKTLLMFGQESIGLSQTAIDLADEMVYIGQRGSVRSLNVASASAIMLQHYSAQVAPTV